MSSSSSNNMLSGLPSKFDGSNRDYPVWKMQMIALLAMHGLMEFIEQPLTRIIKEQGLGEDSSAKKSNNAEEDEKAASVKVAAEQMKMVEETNSKSRKAYGLILFSLGREQIRLFLDIAQGDAYELWKAVVGKYERKTVASKADCLNALYDCKMEKSETFDSYVSRIKLLVSRLKEMQETLSDAQMLYTLFKGLPLEYEPLVHAY